MFTIDLLTNPLFIIVYFSSTIPLAWIVSRFIINTQDKKLQKRLKEIAKKSQARIAKDKKRHDDFMAEINNKMVVGDAKFKALIDCPKYQKLKQGINSEYTAMIQGRNKFNAMIKGGQL
jgi:adenylate kinase family enzyme